MGDGVYHKSRLSFNCKEGPSASTEVAMHLLQPFGDFFWALDGPVSTYAPFLKSILDCSVLSSTSSPNDLSSPEGPFLCLPSQSCLCQQSSLWGLTLSHA